MFEDSLMESRDQVASPHQRWTAVLSVTLQCAFAAAIIALPLLHTEMLPIHMDAPKLVLPLTPLPPPVRHVGATNNPTTAASPSSISHLLARPALIKSLTQAISEVPPSAAPIGPGMNNVDGVSEALATSTVGSSSHVRIVPANPAPKSTLHVSTGVLAGLLLAPITPSYPRIAVTARIEGPVKVEAIISKTGRIESAHVVSGAAMLRQAALDAIENAKYTPYLLNGVPTEVETTITVNFKLSN